MALVSRPGLGTGPIGTESFYKWLHFPVISPETHLVAFFPEGEAGRRWPFRSGLCTDYGDDIAKHLLKEIAEEKLVLEMERK